MSFQNQLSIEKEKFINSGISKYLEFWKLNIVKDDMYAKAMGFYIEYWETTSKEKFHINGAFWAI